MKLKWGFMIVWAKLLPFEFPLFVPQTFPPRYCSFSSSAICIVQDHGMVKSPGWAPCYRN